MSLINKFAALEVSDDEEVVVKKPTTPAPAAATPAAAAGKAAAPAGKAAPAPAAKQGEKKPAGQKAEGQKVDNKPKGDKAPRAPRAEGQKSGENKPKGDRPPRPEGERKPRPEGERRPRPEGERKPRAEGEGERRPRGPRRQEEGATEQTEENKQVDAPKSDMPPRKRQFDRRGPPRKEGEKNEYHGKGNWGKPGSEAAPEEKPEGEAAEASTEQAEKPTEVAPVVEAEPEDKTMTLAEFKKLKESQKKAVQQASARKANEGVDTAAWKNTEQFVREEEAYYVPAEKSSSKKKAEAAAERKAPQVIEFTPKPLIEDKQFTRRFDDKKRGKGPRSKVEPPKLDDKNAFPSLK